MQVSSSVHPSKECAAIREIDTHTHCALPSVVHSASITLEQLLSYNAVAVGLRGESHCTRLIRTPHCHTPMCHRPPLSGRLRPFRSGSSAKTKKEKPQMTRRRPLATRLARPVRMPVALRWHSTKAAPPPPTLTTTIFIFVSF